MSKSAQVFPCLALWIVVSCLAQETPQAIGCEATATTTANVGDEIQFMGSYSTSGGEGGTVYSFDSIVGKLLYVPATGPQGFRQGSPSSEACRDWDESQFTHILTKNQAVMETEVTRQMWAELKAVQPGLPIDPTGTSLGSGAQNPVQRVDWYEAVLFANLLSLKNGYTRVYYVSSSLTTPLDGSNYRTDSVYANWSANGYRLPTEGEWEYFTRAGTTGPFSTNEPNYKSSPCYSCLSGVLPGLEKVAWVCRNDSGRSEPVGQKAANAWGLKDVHGNVWEWNWDLYGTYPDGTQSDYRGDSTGYVRVRRGGSWYSFAGDVRSANRGSNSPVARFSDLGFRLLRSVN